MIFNLDSTAPDFDKLRKMLPQLGKTIARKVRKAARKNGQLIYGSICRQRKYCPVCEATFDLGATTPTALPEAQNCEKCQALLDAGYTAFTCIGKYAFAKHPDLSDMAGKIVRVHSDTMKAMQERGAEVKNTPTKADEQQPPCASE